MAHKLKPVDDTPICDPAYLRRIDPVWVPGPVPQRFWEDRQQALSKGLGGLPGGSSLHKLLRKQALK